MTNRDQIINEALDIAPRLINENLFGSEKAIIVEAIIQLEILIDAIIIIHFFKIPPPKTDLYTSQEHFKEYILKQYNYGKKIELLKKCGLIDTNLITELKSLGKLRNKISHMTLLNDDEKKYYNDLDYIDLNTRFINKVLGNNFITINEIENINNEQVNQCIRNFEYCYSKLIVVLVTLKEKQNIS